MADTLSELLSNVAAFKKGSETATSQVISLLGKQAQSSADIGDIFKQQAADDTVVAAAKNAADMDTQLARVKAANSLGTNLKSNTEVITALSKEANDAYAAKDAALAEIQRKRSINFLDNPVGFIGAAITINRDITTHNLENARMQAAESRLATINSLTQSTAITQNAISEPLTAASTAAANRNAAVAATVASKKSDIDTLSYSTTAINVALNSSKESLAMDFQAQGAKNSARSLQLSEENAAQSRIDFKFRVQEYNDRRADKVAQDDMGKLVVDTVNLGRKALLGDKGTPLDDMSGKLVISALKSKGVLSTEMQKYYEAGERSRVEGRVMIGSTPAAAASTLQALPVQLNPTQAPVQQLLGQALHDMDTGLQEAATNGKSTNPIFNGVNPKDKDSVAKAYNARAQQLLNSYSAVINPADGNNPYQIASINQLYANSPTVRDLPVVQKVLAPVMKTGMQLTDPKQIIGLISDALDKGTITHKEAVELSTVYHVGVKTNLAMRNFEGFGFKQPSYSYNAQIETNPGGFHATEIVDLTKPDSVSRALMKIQASRLQDEFAEGKRNVISGKKDATGMHLFDTRGVAPDSMFQPNPKAADALDAAADSVGQSVTNFFTKTLPHASPESATTPRK